LRIVTRQRNFAIAILIATGLRGANGDDLTENDKPPPATKNFTTYETQIT